MMKHIREISHLGYNAEELYFEKLNRELIRKLKKKDQPEKEEEAPHAQVYQFQKREEKKAA